MASMKCYQFFNLCGLIVFLKMELYIFKNTLVDALPIVIYVKLICEKTIQFCS